MAHPKMEIPDNAHARRRYESAKRHAAAAKAAGKSNEEIHAVFRRVMDFDPFADVDKIPKDEKHAKYRSAVIHAKILKERGESTEKIHDVYKRILSGTAGKHTKK